MLNLLRVPAITRLAFRPLTFQSSQHDLARRLILSQPRRHYAKPGRPRSVVGEPSRPVKRAAKRSSAKATSSTDSPAKQKVQAKKRSAAAKQKPAVKPKPKPESRLTEEQKAIKAGKVEKLKISDLKKAALKPPQVSTASAYHMFTREKGKDIKGEKGSRDEIQRKLGEHSKDVATAWKALSPAELEHYNHLAHTAKENSQAEYKKWVESYTPDAIATANRARSALRRKQPVKKGYHSPWHAIKDERAAKRPMTSYVQFFVNRTSSGDFKNIKTSDRTKLIAQEWKELNQNEKEKYKKLQKEDTDRYVSEYNNVYGHAPPSYNGGQYQPQAAAAAT